MVHSPSRLIGTSNEVLGIINRQIFNAHVLPASMAPLCCGMYGGENNGVSQFHHASRLIHEVAQE